MHLEEYNDWNLPFAKTCLIEPSDADWDMEYDFITDFPSNYYKMNIDPSAYFSIIWLGEEYLDTIPDKRWLRNLNYTFYGE